MKTKLKFTPGIYLAGFMGSGKTTIGRLLADRLGWRFVDLDEQIEAQERTSIAEIFESRGEPEFRRIETDAFRSRVREIGCGRPTVVALGGGTFVEPENFKLIEDNGVSIWLDCPFDLIERRVARAAHRPLARDAKRFEELYESRRSAYGRADYQITVMDDDPSVAVEAILNLPLFQ